MTDEDRKTCPFCLASVPDAASRCSHCASDLYPPADGEIRGWWIVGLVILVVGIAIVSGSENGDGDWAFILVGLGGALVQIGIIATGISVGRRDAVRQEYDHRQGIVNRYRGDAADE